MYKVPHEKFDYSRGEWVGWTEEFSDIEFVEEARRMKRNELRAAIWEDSEGAIDFEALDSAVDAELAKYSDEQLLEQYRCFYEEG